jgi:hypothetical protein
MKLILTLALTLVTGQLFAESYQMDSWTCSSGDVPKKEFDHLNAKTLLNLRPNFTYDLVSIDADFWGLERGYYRHSPNQLCLEAREGAQYERAYWSGRLYRGCAETSFNRDGHLDIRVLNHDGAVCKRNDVIVLHYRLLGDETKNNPRNFTGLPF